MDDTVFVNGKIYTPDGLDDWMHIQGNQIVRTGKGEFGREATLIDLKGRLILPGLHDSHIHLYSQGRFSSRLNLKQCGSISELQLRLEEYSQGFDGEWVIGGGWDQDYMEDGRYPTRKDIDAVIDDRPVLLYRGCNHIGLVNSMGLEKMGLDHDFKDVEGGKIDRDEHGEPTGILRENALDLVKPYISHHTLEEKREFLKRGVDDCLRYGLTAVQTNDVNGWELYRELIEREELDIRVFLTVPFDELSEEETPTYGQQEGLLRCDRIKLFADGSLGAETAALRHPYKGTDNQGILIDTPSVMTEKINRAKSLGYRLEVHAIGDRAAEIVLDGFDNAGVGPEDRAVLTHCQILGKDLVERIKEKGIIANIQPPFVRTDSKWADKRIADEEQLRYAYAWKTLLNENVHCAGGSDAPIETPDPFYGIYMAITRENDTGKPWREKEKLTFEEALRLYTEGSAYAAGEEDRLGRLQSGYLADFVIVDSAILDNPISLLDNPVYETWVDGRRRYQRRRTSE